MAIPIFPFFGGLNSDPDIPDCDYEDLFYEDVVDDDWSYEDIEEDE